MDKTIPGEFQTVRLLNRCIFKVSKNILVFHYTNKSCAVKRRIKNGIFKTSARILRLNLTSNYLEGRVKKYYLNV